MTAIRFRKPLLRERLAGLVEFAAGIVLLSGLGTVLPMSLLVGGAIGACIGASVSLVVEHGPNRLREAFLTMTVCAVAGATLTGAAGLVLLRLSG